MKIEYASGRKVEVESEHEARAILGDVVYGDWQPACGCASERMLVWSDDDDAENDDGSRAMAQIIR